VQVTAHNSLPSPSLCCTLAPPPLRFPKCFTRHSCRLAKTAMQVLSERVLHPPPQTPAQALWAVAVRVGKTVSCGLARSGVWQAQAHNSLPRPSCMLPHPPPPPALRDLLGGCILGRQTLIQYAPLVAGMQSSSVTSRLGAAVTCGSECVCFQTASRPQLSAQPCLQPLSHCT
jgi:hypothetical protein